MNATEQLPGLRSKSFIGIVATQFFTSLNDNAYRWLIIPIGTDILGVKAEGAELSIGLACFVTPYVLLFGPAGYLADRYPKRRVMSICMLAQALILACGVMAILFHSIVGAFLTLVGMGIQGALLAPSKGGSIPESVRPDRVSAANGVCGLAAITASMIGTVSGNELYVLTKPAGQHHWWLYAAVMVGAALLGYGGTRLVHQRPPADPGRAFPWRPLKSAARDFHTLWQDRRLFVVACASAYFWFLASLSQVNVYLYGTTQLHIGPGLVGPLLGLLALGAGLGAILAGVLSRGRVRLQLTPLSAFGIALAGILLDVIPGHLGGRADYVASGVLLFMLGMTAGLYDVPLQSYLQTHSRIEIRGRILASTTSMMFLSMLISAGAFWIMEHSLHLSGGTIFLTAGIATVPVAVALFYAFAPPKRRRLGRLFGRLATASAGPRPSGRVAARASGRS